MPAIFFYGPELDNDKSRELISAFTEAASRITGIQKAAFQVYLRPATLDNVGIGGELLKDIFERQKK